MLPAAQGSPAALGTALSLLARATTPYRPRFFSRGPNIRDHVAFQARQLTRQH